MGGGAALAGWLPSRHRSAFAGPDPTLLQGSVAAVARPSVPTRLQW